MIKETGVAAKITADSTGFTRACSQARLAAAALTKDLKKVKFEGFGGGMHKSADGKEMISFEQKLRSERKLTNLEYEKTNRLLGEMAKKVAIPDMRSWSKAVMSGRGSASSGQWSHLAGTQFAGGARGAGRGGKGGGGYAGSLGYGASVGYNAIQDVWQGGLPAIANNVPQIIGLVAASPALKMLGAASFAAAASFFAYKFGREVFSDDNNQAAGNRYAQNRAASEQKYRSLNFGKGMAAAGDSGEAAGAAGVAAGQASAAEEALAQQRAGFAEDQKNAEAELRRIKIQGITDPADRAMAQAQEDKRLITERYALEKQLAEDNLQRAGKEWDAASRRLGQIKDELKSFGNLALTPDELIRQKQLQAELPGAQTRYDSAKSRATDAFTGRDNAALRAGQAGVENEIVDAKLEQALGDAARANLNKFFDSLKSGTEAAMRIAEAYEEARLKAAEQAKQQGKMEEQLQIAELTSGGRRSRRAEKMQRGMNVDEAAGRYESAGYNKETARAMAEREIAAGERRPGTIRGAGFGSKSGTERGSALDYFDGKKMDGPTTSNLDDYEARRRIPGVGKSVDKKLADDAKVEVAKPNPKGDPAVVALLKAILGALGGTEPDSSSSSSGSGRKTIKGAGYQG